MGGPLNTFTGATQPIPVGSDGSVQAGPPDAIAGRDTRGVVIKNSTPLCVSPYAMRLRVWYKSKLASEEKKLENDLTKDEDIIDIVKCIQNKIKQ